ncbi:MAG: SDR family oxidoreductase [Deltaproteobacteria bacterium]|nr:SDR family oxidoreductase [Deltaproteobacteria bacterium]
MTHVLLTGATGALGAAILEGLLARDDTAVSLLLRGPDDAAVARRCDELLDGLLGPEGAAAAESRVRAVRGDITHERLGLEPAAHDGLAERCTHVVHCAAQIRMNLPREAARAAAVDGTAHVLDFARAVRNLRKLEVVSTIGVGGRLPEVPEEWLDRPRAFHNTYEEAKAEAETLLRRAADELPLTVHRPSMVVGDSRTGRVRAFQVFYHLCEFLAGVRSRGLVPRLGDARVDTVPMDWFVRTVLWSLDHADAAGHVLHECAGPEAILLRELQPLVRERFRAAGLSVPLLLPLPAWSFRLLLGPLTLVAPPKLQRALKTAPVFLDYLEERRLFRTERTRELLAADGLELPPPAAYLPVVIDYYLQRRPARRGST